MARIETKLLLALATLTILLVCCSAEVAVVQYIYEGSNCNGKVSPKTIKGCNVIGGISDLWSIQYTSCDGETATKLQYNSPDCSGPSQSFTVDMRKCHDSGSGSSWFFKCSS